MQASRQAVGPSRPTQTLTSTSAGGSASPSASVGTLRLRGQQGHGRRVAWTQGTVDNEKLGRKSSKICCIYHRPKQYDESSSDSSGESSEDEHDFATRGKGTARNKGVKRKHDDREQEEDKDAGAPGFCCDGHAHSEAGSLHKVNAYEKVVK